MKTTSSTVFVSDLGKQAFCEYELYLRDVRGITDPGSAAEDEGRLIHAALDSANAIENSALAAQRRASGKPVPSSIEDVVSIVRAEQQPMSIRDVVVKGTRLYGRIDQVDFTPSAIRIIDDKPPSPNGIPFIDDTRQVQGYCLAFGQQRPGTGLPLVAVIRDRNNGKELWSKPFTAGDALEIEEVIDRILGIRFGKRDAMPTRNPRKCARCSWNRHCDRRS